MEKGERAKEQAKAQLDSIVTMVKRLGHCQECAGGEGCELTDEEILKGIDLYSPEGKVDAEEREQYHNEEDARQAIEEDPLSVEVRSDWHCPGDGNAKPSEYTILLCTGGPACRIIGDLDEYQQPYRARLEYQDWFTPWVEYLGMSYEEHETLLTYAREFYYGE